MYTDKESSSSTLSSGYCLSCKLCMLFSCLCEVSLGSLIFFYLSKKTCWKGNCLNEISHMCKWEHGCVCAGCPLVDLHLIGVYSCFTSNVPASKSTVTLTKIKRLLQVNEMLQTLRQPKNIFLYGYQNVIEVQPCWNIQLDLMSYQLPKHTELKNLLDGFYQELFPSLIILV